jgi:type I restriction enzyme M protein
MKPIERGGSRIGIVFNGSPLFTGAADSGESNIRKWIIEQDWLEAIVALPDQLFYNTGISTYIWILTNRKEEKRKGKIQLINGNSFFQKMRKSLGNKRQELNKEHLAELTRIYGEYENSEFSKIFDNEDFGYSRITVERPLKLNFQICEERINKITFVKAFEESKETILKILQSKQSDKIFKNREEFIKTLKAIFKNTEISYNANLEKALLNGLSEKDETADICKDSKGNTEADSDLRDYENIPLKHNIKEYFEKEVLPHVPDAWIDESKTKIGYEIPFTRHFYVYKPLRPLDKINDELKIVEDQILNLLQGVSA